MVTLLVGLTLVAAACTGDTEPGTAAVEALPADDAQPAEATTSATSGPSSTSTSTSTSTSSSSTSSSTSTEVVRPGASGAFTSPTGNIACIMDQDGGASCFIGDKDWTIAAPTEPDCEFDFGNAIDVTPLGASYPCYSDFSWDPDAPVLDYGSSMEVGEFRCESARTGVTCVNAAGEGFVLSRSRGDLL